MSARRRLPPGARWITLPSGQRRVELVVDLGENPATGQRRQTRRRFKTADEAIAEYAKIKQRTREGTFVGRSGVTVDEVCRDWLAARRSVRPSTLAGYRDVLKPVRAAYGALPVQRLTKRHIDDLIPQLLAGTLKRANGRKRRPWGGRTTNLMLFTLGKVLDDAMRQGLVTRNVAALVDRLPQAKTEMLTYTKPEVRKVLEAARTDRLEAAWHLSLSGLRRGEVCGLRLDRDVDLAAKTLTITETYLVIEGEAIVGEPKTERGKRTLPLSPQLVKVLRRAKRRRAAEQLAVGAAYRDTGYLVVDELGERLHPEVVSDRWDRLVESAGVRRIRLHDARHTCGTLMHLEGVPTAVVSAWLGHSNSAFTMRTYVHSQDPALRAAADVLGTVTSV